MCKDVTSCKCGCSTKRIGLRPRKLSYGGGFPIDVNSPYYKQMLAQQGIGTGGPTAGQQAMQQAPVSVNNPAITTKPADGAGGMGAGTIAGVAGGIGVAAEGLSSANQMSVPSAAVDPQGNQLGEVAKMEAQEKAVNNGAATAATAINPLLGAAFKVGGAISSGIRDSNKDSLGIQKTNAMGVAKQTVAEIADPLSANMRAFKRFSDSDYSTSEKIFGAIPMMGGLFTRAGNERKAARIRAQMTSQAINKSESAIYAANGIKLRPHRLVGGGPVPKRKSATAPTAQAQRDSVFMRDFRASEKQWQQQQQPGLTPAAPASAPTGSVPAAGNSMPAIRLRPRVAAGSTDSVAIYNQQLADEQARIDKFHQAIPAVMDARAADRNGLGTEVLVPEWRQGKELYGKPSGDNTCIANGTCGLQQAGKVAGLTIKKYVSNQAFVQDAQAGRNGYQEVTGPDAIKQVPVGSPIVVDHGGGKYHFTVKRGAQVGGQAFDVYRGSPTDAHTIAMKKPVVAPVYQDHGNEPPENGYNNNGQYVYNERRGLEADNLFNNYGQAHLSPASRGHWVDAGVEPIPYPDWHSVWNRQRRVCQF